MADFCRRALAYITASRSIVPEEKDSRTGRTAAPPSSGTAPGCSFWMASSVCWWPTIESMPPRFPMRRPTNQPTRSLIATPVPPSGPRTMTCSAPSLPLPRRNARHLPAGSPRVAQYGEPTHPWCSPRIPLPGLRPADAEALLRSCGVTGHFRGRFRITSRAIAIATRSSSVSSPVLSMTTFPTKGISTPGRPIQTAAASSISPTLISSRNATTS